MNNDYHKLPYSNDPDDFFFIQGMLLYVLYILIIMMYRSFISFPEGGIYIFL